MNTNLTLEEIKNDSELMLDFISFFFDFKMYNYQTNFLIKCFNNNRIAGKWSRQSGKSQAVSIYVLLRAIIQRTDIIIVSPTQNQSNEMFKKVKDIINQNNELRTLIQKDTQTEIILVNGSRIISLPSGPEGRTIKGYTCDILIIEEAGLMNDYIVNAVLVPMLASKGSMGQIIKIGTPWTRNHFFRSCYEDTNYKVVNVTWEDALKEGQYTQEFIDEQRLNLTDIEFKTEYEAEFISDKMAFFPIKLLDSCSLEYTMITVI